MASGILHLPLELQQKIASYLDAPCLRNLSLTNRHFRDILKDSKFLNRAARQQLDFPVKRLNPENPMGCYLLLFKFREHINKLFFNRYTHTEDYEKNKEFLKVIFDNRTYTVKGYICSVWGTKKYKENLKHKLYKQLLFSVNLDESCEKLKNTVYQVQDFFVQEQCDECGGQGDAFFNKNVNKKNIELDDRGVLSVNNGSPHQWPNIEISYLPDDEGDMNKRRKRVRETLHYTKIRNDARHIDSCKVAPSCSYRAEVFESQTLNELLEPGILCGFPTPQSKYEHWHPCECGLAINENGPYNLVAYNVEHFRRFCNEKEFHYCYIESPDFEHCQTGGRLAVDFSYDLFPSPQDPLQKFSLSLVGNPDCNISPNCIPKFYKYLKDDPIQKGAGSESWWCWKTVDNYDEGYDQELHTDHCQVVIFDKNTVGFVPKYNKELFILTRIDDLLNRVA